MEDFYAEMSAEQRRQLIDAQQVFGVWRGPFTDFTTIRGGADLEAAAMAGAEWLLQSSPHFEQVIVGGDGLALRIVTPEPGTYALHKLCVAGQDSRTQLKRPRGREHSKVVAQLCLKYLQRPLVSKEMPWPAPAQ